jgi:beta-aspartyl-peptidase (threonine type)
MMKETIVMRTNRPSRIIVHGGAGFWKRDIRKALIGVRRAATVGADALSAGGSALDAVEAAVSAMEDDSIFNAGKGSALTISGTVEMDAAIMDGIDLSAGAVALVRKVKNPVRLARLVMEKTDHVFVAGQTAEKLARAYSLPLTDPITPRRRRMLLEMMKGSRGARMAWVQRNPTLLRRHPEIIKHDTVGALALDTDGNFAAASSTGGTTMKLPGRIGDTPQIGSGLYSDNRSGAATVTGVGEIAVRLTLSKAVCTLMERGLRASKAAELMVRTASERLNGEAGVIAIDRHGRIAAVHNTPYMPWAFWSHEMHTPRATSRGKIVARVR